MVLKLYLTNWILLLFAITTKTEYNFLDKFHDLIGKWAVISFYLFPFVGIYVIWFGLW